MRKLFYILLLCSFFCGRSFGQANGIIFDTPFESTSEVTNNGDTANSVWESNGKPFTLVTNNVRQGNSAIRLSYENSSTRTELNTDAVLNWGMEYWIGLAMRVVEDVTTGRVALQMRQIPTNSTNPITLRSAANGQIRIAHSTNPSNADATPVSGASWGANSTYFNRTIGEWIDIVIHYIGHYQNGTMEVWINGEKLVNIQNGTTLYRRDENGNILDGVIYLKIGPYWGNTTPSGIYEYDRYRVWEGSGGSYEAVHPTGASPNGSNPTPNCNDGIMNGDETGVDCGGSCDPCPTCNDGIMNGDETGVDCGGSCDPCPTCNDGVMNGDETGVDCGGSCDPCGTPAPNPTRQAIHSNRIKINGGRIKIKKT